MLRGSTPVQLAQLDISPAIQAGALEQQGIQQVAAGLQTAILEFSQKQQEKKVKRERDAQIDAFLPGLLESTGLDIEAGTPEYNAFAQYLKKTSGDDILSGIKQIQEFAPEPTPSLQTITGPGGQQVYTYGGEVIDPDKVIDPYAPVSESLGFDSEYPSTYLVNYDDAGTPDDLTDDTEAYRVDVVRVNEVSPGLQDKDGNPITKGQQVYYDKEGKLNVLDLNNMRPMEDAQLTKLQFNDKVAETANFRSYIDSRGRMSDSGGARFLEGLSFNYKNIVGDDAVTEAEYATAEGKARFRAQLGALRIPILGPGVLTEFDRQVLEQAIGGFGPLSNNRLAINLINQYLERGIAEGIDAGRMYNEIYRQAPSEIKIGMRQADLKELQGNLIIQPTKDIVSDLAVAFEDIDSAAAFLKERGELPGFSFKYEGKFYKLK
jgi:hypothetical protein